MCIVQCMYTCCAWLPCAAHIYNFSYVESNEYFEFSFKKILWGAVGTPKLELHANIYFVLFLMPFSIALSGRVIPGCTTRR